MTDIYNLLVEKDEISWKSIMMDLIRSEEMNPWDVDVSLLAKRYVERIHELKESDLKVGGKVLLAAAILLRVKSTRLVGDDLDEFDRLVAGSNMTQEEFYDELEQELAQGEKKVVEEEDYELLPRMPQARRRKVSVFDLVKALEKALEVKKRRVWNNTPPVMPIPARKFDITSAISGLLQRITSLFSVRKKLTFSQLLSKKTKEEKVYTFIPMLHLMNDQKIEVEQDEHFGEMTIKVVEGKNV